MSRRLVRASTLVAAVLLTLVTGTGAQRVAQVPSPRDVLGFDPGTDYMLADFGQLRSYMRALDAASDRVQVDSAGRSTEGREMLVAVISSEANLARLARYQDISRRLALVRGVDDGEARALAAEGRAIVWIDNGLHASEVATAQHALRAGAPGRHRRQSGDAGDSRERDPRAPAVHQSRRHGHGGRLVPAACSTRRTRTAPCRGCTRNTWGTTTTATATC